MCHCASCMFVSNVTGTRLWTNTCASSSFNAATSGTAFLYSCCQRHHYSSNNNNTSSSRSSRSSKGWKDSNLLRVLPHRLASSYWPNLKFSPSSSSSCCPRTKQHQQQQQSMVPLGRSHPQAPTATAAGAAVRRRHPSSGRLFLLLLRQLHNNWQLDWLAASRLPRLGMSLSQHGGASRVMCNCRWDTVVLAVRQAARLFQ